MQITTSRATYTLETQLISYSNPSHRLASGDCCLAGCGPCRVQFMICRRNHGQNVGFGGCPQGEVAITGPVSEAEDGSILFNATGNLFEGANVFNPITKTGPTWTVSLCTSDERPLL